MRWFARIVTITGLLLFQQLGLAYVGSAQVDPCEPVPIPELCEEEPLPEPTDPGATNDPGDDPTGGTGGDDPVGGGGGTTTGGSGDGGNGGPSSNGGGKTSGNKSGGKGGSKLVKVQQGPFVFGGPNNTERLIQILSKLKPYGISLQRGLLKVVGPFPVAGPSYWTNDWHACRDGCTRFHEGLDMFAPTGTPLVAIADGVVTQKVVGELSGISVEIQDSHGVQYFYAHLDDWAPGLRAGQQVQQGDVIGYVGNTGNAIYTPPHLHLEVQPGGVPVPPKPFVDKWLELSERQAAELVTDYTGKEISLTAQGAASNFRLTRLFDLAGGAGTTTATGDQLLTLLGIQPTSLDITTRWVGQMAWEIDWASQSDAELAALAEEVTGQDLSGATPWSPLGPGSGSSEGLDQGTVEVGD
jgi:murein DD-endopeptidase MepM/ murein hydrolase activator NlpD